MGIALMNDGRGSGHVVTSYKPRCVNNNGFSLLEVLVAITILLLIAVAMLPLFSGSLNDIVESGEQSVDQYTAQQGLENTIAAGGASTSDSLTIQFSGGTLPEITVHGITQTADSLSVFIPNELGIIVPDGGRPEEGTSNLPYTFAFTATGGVTPYSFTISQGTLPDGLELNETTGAVTGTPTSSTTSTFTLQVTDSSSPSMVRTREFSIVINN